MNTNNWNSNGLSDLGQEIRDMVEKAVDSRSYGELSGRICDTVIDGLDRLRENVQKNAEQNHSGSRHYTSERYRNGEAAGPGQTSYRQRKGYAEPTYGGSSRYQNASAGKQSVIPHPLYAKTTGEKAGGAALTAVGYTFAGGSSLAILILALVGLADAWTSGMVIASGILGIVTAGFGTMAWQGTRLLGKVRRFRKYVDGMKGRTFCEIRELAPLVGKKEKYVVKDLQKMISSGWFREGHLDRQQTCLIVTHETYQQYQNSQKQLEARQQQQLEQQKQDQLTPEVREMIRAGKEYIDRIEKSNDAIPGEEISEKIAHMQMIVEKIFLRVREHPEYADDLRKFMDYYLPTTVKLLDAYEELDRQPVQGENIQNSKLEIEKTLDTLNQAFEKILDSLFEETAWDVSTDISVLKTMLAQEGLTDTGFTQK